MKVQPLLLLIILLMFQNCRKDDRHFEEGGFSIRIRDRVYTENEIDYYDFSSHLIYLKPGVSFKNSSMEPGTFSVKVFDEEIYQGNLLPVYSSLAPHGIYIYLPSFYGDFVIPVNFSAIDKQSDPRNDPRIENSLKTSGKYRGGLLCEFVSIQKQSSSRVTLTIKVTNNDICSLYILDPGKMGQPLYHFFTNGLHFYKSDTHERFENNYLHASPDDLYAWNPAWLSALIPGDSRLFTFEYPNFERVPTGAVRAYFQFPGLHFQMKRDQVKYQNGRIWIGQIQLEKDIVLP